MDYALRARDMTYFTRGVARRKARYIALACLNNLGFLTGFGDTPGLIPVIGFNVLARASWAYRDPRLCWIIRNVLPPNSGLRVFGRNIALNLDVTPTRPDGWTGVIHIPIYKRTLNKGESSKSYVWDPKEPVAPELFNKIVFKENWRRDGQYLLLDGAGASTYKGRRVGPMGHGHRDINTIINFTALDRMWLVDHTYSGGVFQNHSGVFVTRDGRQDCYPGSPVLLRGLMDSPTLGLTCTTFGKWTRGIVWRKGRWFAVLDKIVADKDGEYFARATFKTLGEHTISGHELRLSQKGRFCRIVTDGRSALSVETRREQNHGAFAHWYRYAPPTPKYFKQDKLRRLKAGESLGFASVLYPYSNEGDADAVKLLPIDESQALVIDGDTPALVALGGKQGPALTVVTEGALLALGADSLGQGLFKTDGPCDVALETKSGTLMLRTVEPRQVVLAGRLDAVLSLQSSGALATKDGDSAPIAKGRSVGVKTEGGKASFSVRPGTYVLALKGWDGFAALRRRNAAKLAAATANARGYAATAAKESRRTESRGLRLERVRLDMPINGLFLVDLDGDGVKEWLTPGPKGVRAYTAAGKRIWAFDTKQPVRALAVGDVNGDGRPEIAAGCDDHHVYLLSREGRKLWAFKCKPSFGSMATPPKVDRVWIEDLEGDGKPEVLAGANWFHVLDAKGKVKWENFARRHRDTGPIWGDFVVGDVVDLFGDGKKECVVIYDDSYPFMTIYRHDGKPVKSGRDRAYSGPSRWRHYVWPPMAVKGIDLIGGKRAKQIAVPSKGFLLGYWPGQVGSASQAFAIKGSFIGMTVFQPDPSRGAALVTAGEMTEVRAWLDWRVHKKVHRFSWPRQWTRPLGENITAILAVRLAPATRDFVFAGTANGGVYVLDMQSGKIVAVTQTGGRAIRALVQDAESVLAAQEDGVVLRIRVD